MADARPLHLAEGRTFAAGGKPDCEEEVMAGLNMPTARKWSSVFRTWPIGLSVAIACLLVQIYIGTAAARKSTAPILQMPSTWLWVASPYVGIAIGIAVVRGSSKAVGVMTIAALICLLSGGSILWFDSQATPRPGGMNPWGGGGPAPGIALLASAILQWVLVVIATIISLVFAFAGQMPVKE